MREPGWSLERVVSELRQLHAGGETISYAGLRAAGFGSLVTAAERCVGSFSRALKLAGIEPVRPTWTKQRVLAEIKRLHREGIALSSEQLSNGGGRAGLVQAARKHFGSWPSAVVAAGVPKFKRGPWKTWAMVRDRLHELHQEGVNLTTTGLQADGQADLVAAAISYAGTWNQALRKARLPVTQVHHEWSENKVRDDIRALARAGIPLNANIVIARGNRKLVKAATAYFGTWQNACRAAMPNYKPLVKRWTIELVVARIRDRHRAGRSVRSTVVAKEEPNVVMAARRLGLAWRDACRRAGVPKSAIAPLKPPTRVRWTEEAIVAELEKAVRSGRLLVVRNFPGGFVQAVQRRFNSWAEAMTAARLEKQYERDRNAAIANRLGGAVLRER